MRALSGSADWDTGFLGGPQILDADPTGRSGPLAATAAAALVAMADGDREAAVAAAAILGPAGVVAVRSGRARLEVRETLDGWEVSPLPVPTPDIGDLGSAAVVRAWRLAEARRTGQDRP